MFLVQVDVTDIHGRFLRLTNNSKNLKILAFDSMGRQIEEFEFQTLQDLRNLRDALTLLLGKGK